MIDRNGKPIGTDFASFYAARFDGARRATPPRSGDMTAHYAREQQIFGAATPYYGWLYPPIFLLVAVPLALLPYSLALIIWQGASFALYLAVIAAILAKLRRENGAITNSAAAGRRVPLLPSTGLGHGQNGFLTAGLLGAALLSLPQRPLLSGVLFGLLAYKPQFGLLIPIALLVAGQWRAIVAATLTVIVLMAITTPPFSARISGKAFAASTGIARKILLEQGDVGFEKLQSVFAAIRMWGGSVPLAYWVQSAASFAAIGGVAWAWRMSDNRDIKAALGMIATLLALPHALDYDLTILGPAIAFLVAARWPDGFRSFDISLLAAAWITPLFARGIAGLTGIPLGLMAIVALYALTMRHALARRDANRASVI